MTIQGQLEYGQPLVSPMDSGILCLVGEDGNHYIQAHPSFGADFNLSKIDTETTLYFTLTQAQAQTQLASLSLPGVVAADWLFGWQGGFIITNTPFFVIPMYVPNFGTPARQVNIWLRYKVDSGGNVVFDGYTGGACGSGAGWFTVGCIGYSFIGVANSNPIWGANSINGVGYAVCRTGQLFLFSDTFATHLIQIPLSGNYYDDTAGTWDAFITELPTIWTSYLADNPIRQYTNRASIMADPSGNIRVFIYLSQGSGVNLGFGGAACLTSLVDPVAHTASASQDCSSIFGIPFPDTLYSYAGSLTTDARNDYTSPTCIGTDVFFMRGFDDQTQIARYRLFSIGGENLTNIQVFDVVEGVYTTVDPSGLNGSIEFIQAFREDNILYTMGRFNSQYVFGNMGAYPNIPPEPPAEGGGTPYYIERMDNRIWPTIEDAWCLDAALELEQPVPEADLAVSSATGDGAIRSYNIINGGSGYTAPIGQVSDAGGPGSGATVTLSITGGVIDVATAVLIGSNYVQPAVLSILDTTGVGAVIQPLVTNYTTLSTNTSSFTSSDVGSIVRVGGGRIEIVSYSSTTSVIGNVIAPITATVPNDPNNTPVVATAGEWTMTMPVTTVSGLWHLEGLTVSALADGGVVNDLVVANGSVTLPVSASQILVGLPFVAQLQTMYLDAGAGPTVQGRRKDITQTVIRVENSRAPEVGLNQPDAAAQPNQAEIPWGGVPYTAMVQIKDRTPAMFAGTAIPLYSGDLEITSLFSTWDSKGQIAVQQRNPLPLTVTALVPWVDVGDTPSRS